MVKYEEFTEFFEIKYKNKEKKGGFLYFKIYENYPLNYIALRMVYNGVDEVNIEKDFLIAKLLLKSDLFFKRFKSYENN